MPATVSPKVTTRKSSRRVLWLGIFLFIVFTMSAAVWYWNTNKEEIIGKKLEKAIREKSAGLYKITYDSILVDELGGNLTITDMRINIDSAAYFEKHDQAPPMLVNLGIPRISISGLKTPKALIDDEIIAKKLEIIDPDIEILYTGEGERQRNLPEKQLYEQLLGDLDLIQVDSLLITDAGIKARNLQSGKKEIDLRGFSVVLTEVRIDSAAYADESRILFSKKLTAGANEISWTSKKNSYRYSSKNISVNSENGNIQVGEFVIDPGMGEAAFVNAHTVQKDRVHASFKNIRLLGVDMKTLADEQLYADKMIIGNLHVKLFRDASKPRDSKSRKGRSPHQAIQHVSFPFLVSNVTIGDSYIEYKEKNRTTGLPGIVSFHDLHAVIKNFGNQHKGNNQVMTIATQSRFLNKTPLAINWTFYPNDINGRFEVNGKSGTLDARALNVLTEPMCPAHIEDGFIHGLDFNFTGNDDRVTGKVNLLYEELEVEVLEMEPGAKKPDKKFLTSILANVIIDNSNPKKNEPPRVAMVTHPRDPSHTIFNASWKALFSGIREITGIPETH